MTIITLDKKGVQNFVFFLDLEKRAVKIKGFFYKYYKYPKCGQHS